jgi:hypothetical protein
MFQSPRAGDRIVTIIHDPNGRPFDLYLFNVDASGLERSRSTNPSMVPDVLA